jgi:hypothetical protein
MISIPLLDELREIRRRLAAACQEDPFRYARMLEEETRAVPGNHVSKSLLPSAPPRSKSVCLPDERQISP